MDIKQICERRFDAKKRKGKQGEKVAREPATSRKAEEGAQDKACETPRDPSGEALDLGPFGNFVQNLSCCIVKCN